MKERLFLRFALCLCVSVVLWFSSLCIPHCAFFSSLASAETSVRVIGKIAVEGIYSISKEELLDLLDLKVGGALDPLKLRAGIKRAFTKGIFDDIEVYADAGGREQDIDEFSVRVMVKEKDIIGKISVAGNVYVSGREIKGHFMLKEDKVMRTDLLDKAVEAMEGFLSEKGFPEAVVSVSTVRTNKPNTVELTLTVDERKPLLIKKIVVHGAPEEEIRGLISLREEDIYDRVAVNKEMEGISADYKHEGYLKPVVSYAFANGTLDLSIEKGKKLVVDFQGNEAFGQKRLMKVMPFFDAGEVRDDLIDEAVRRIESLYHGEGYVFAQAVPVLSGTEEKSPDIIELHFFVYEGEKVSVAAINFTGITLPEKNLKEILSLKEDAAYNPELLSSDAEVLREFYNALGYVNVDVKEPEVSIADNHAVIAFSIKEGSKTIVDSIEITGAKSLPIEELKRVAGIKSGNPYNEIDIADARYRLIDAYLEQGYGDVVVGVKIDLGKEGARIVFEIEEGERKLFGKTVVIGNRKTKIKVIEREALFKESAPLNYNLLAQERQKLYKLGLFRDVSIELLDIYDSKRDVHIHVVEGNAGAVEFGIGYGDFEKERGFVDISYRNLFGMNRQISFRLEHSSLENRYIVNYIEPWFFGKPTPFRAVLLGEEKTEKNIDTGEVEYRLRRQTVTVGFEKKLTKEIKGQLFYEFSLVNTFDVKPDVILTREDTGTLAISGIKPGIIYDTRDNPFDPRKGILAGLTVKVASAVLFSETDFAKMIFNGSLYHELSRTFVLAASFRFGLAQGFGSTRELPLVERLFLGGRDTVRGYAQDSLGPKGVNGSPTGGNAFMLTNFEMRTSLGKGIGLVNFVDAGNVWVRASDVDWSLKYTAGIGLRYSTPVGPLRVDYGYKLKRELGLSSGEIHFSIGHAF